MAAHLVYIDIYFVAKHDKVIFWRRRVNHESEPPLVAFTAKISLQSQNFVHKFVLDNELIGLPIE